MTTRSTLAARLRTTALATILAATGFLTAAVPGTMPAEPSGSSPFGGIVQVGNDLFAPKAALAAYCASNPTFTGYLTASTSSHPAAARITDPDLYAWISNVDSTWSCTAYYRFDGVAWNTTASAGRFEWGLLITSKTVACNYEVGSNDYVKGNATADCPDTDAEYALPLTLTAERVYQQDVAHDDIGDLSFVHSDCSSAYGGSDGHALAGSEPGWTNPPQNFNAGNVDNRPGDNCDPLTIDAFNASQTITYDKTGPAAAFTAPAAGGPAVVPSASYTVAFTPSDNLAGISAAGWSLQRQKAPWSGSTCGTYANDGSPVTGTATGAQLVGQSLELNTCYRWAFSATDLNGNAGSTTSGSIRTDTSGVLGLQAHLRTEAWDLGAGDSLAVSTGSGNAVISHPVVSLPIRGSSVSIGLTYNSHDSGNVGLGTGWRTSMDRRLESPAWGSDITFTAADGGRHRFTWVSGTSSYTRPATLYAGLSQQGSGFRLAYRDGSYDLFTAAGLLAEERDRFGNGVTLDRTVANQVSVVDIAGGRSILIASTGGLVRSITDWAYVQDGIVQVGSTGTRRMTCLYYAGSTLAGWTDAAFPYPQPGTCPASLPASSHATRLAYTSGLVTGVSKTQTYETLVAGALGTGTRTVTTAIAYSGADVASVTDAEGGATSFTHPATDPAIRGVGQTQVVRPGTPTSTTVYTLASPTDPYGRTTSVKRRLGAAWIEERTAYDATYPVEPASVTENYVDGSPSDAAPDEDRTTTYTYVAGSMGLVARVTEPLTASTHRTTDSTYNANNDVTQTITALDGSATVRTVSRSCYDASCTLTGAGLTLLRTIENYTDGTAGNGTANVEDVTTTYEYDTACAGGTTCGQRTLERRSNYPAAGGLPLDTAATGWTWDSLGNQTAEIRNFGNGTVSGGADITPDTSLPTSANARTDLTTAYTYDTAGNRVTVADPRRAIDAAQWLALENTDYVSSTVYDPLNQATTSLLPTSPARLGVAACTPLPGCRLTTTEYDELGLARQTTDVDGKQTATLYDRAGRATETYQDDNGPGGAAARLTGRTHYDAGGRVDWTENELQANDAAGGADPGRTEYLYDELGRTVSVTEAADSLSPTVESTTATTYDALGRRTAETTGTESPDAQTTRWTYDLGGRVLDEDDGFTCSTTTSDWRDLATGTVEGRTPGTPCTGTGTRTITQAFDALGRLTSRAVQGGAVLEASTYDSAGHALATRSSDGTIDRVTETTWNPLDVPVEEYRYSIPTAGGTKAGQTWSRANRDPAGNETDHCTWAAAPTEWCHRASDPGWASPQPISRSSSEYDARNSRVKQYTPGAGTTTYDPAAGYQVKGVFLPTAGGKEHQTLYAYDARDRLDTITVLLCATSQDPCQSVVAGTQRMVDDYGYDANDNRTWVAEDSGAGLLTTTYGYDGRNQLVTDSSAATACPGGYSYGYDEAGNRTCAAGRTFAYVNGSGQLESCTGTACAPVHDADGRLTGLTSATGTWSYLYDGEGRLTSACRSTSCTGTGFARLDSVYDGEGHRVRLVETPASGPATTTDFAYEGDAIVRETATTGTTTVTRTFTVDEAGGIVRMTVAGMGTPNDGDYLVVWNGHGDAVELSWIDPATGLLSPANRFTYSTWGTPTLATVGTFGDLGFRYRYVGRYDVQWDSTPAVPSGLLYMHARHYSPELGRFLQPDPSAAEANLYGYAGNSPATNVDPQGTCWQCIAQTIARLVDKLKEAANWLSRWRIWGGLTRLSLFSARLRVDLGDPGVRAALLRAAQRLDPSDKGGKLTLVGRALEKHGNLFGGVTGNVAAKNERGLEILTQIVRDSATRIQVTPTGAISARVSVYAGEHIDLISRHGVVARFYLPTGQAVSSIRFVGFRSP